MVESQKVSEALCQWLDNQQVTAADGVAALCQVAGTLIATRSTDSDALMEGISILQTLVLLEAMQAYCKLKGVKL